MATGRVGLGRLREGRLPRDLRERAGNCQSFGPRRRTMSGHEVACVIRARATGSWQWPERAAVVSCPSTVSL